MSARVSFRGWHHVMLDTYTGRLLLSNVESVSIRDTDTLLMALFQVTSYPSDVSSTDR